MGMMEATEIITEALELAGDTSLETRAGQWLNAFLWRVAGKCAWPTLQRRFVGDALAAGAEYMDVGNGAGGVSVRISRVNRMILHDGLSGGFVQEVDVRNLEDVDAADMPGVVKSSTGAPSMFVAEPEGSTDNRWRLHPNSVTQQAYSTIILANLIPVMGEGSRPFYENDDTMIQALFVRALNHQDDPRADSQMSILRTMEKEDVVRYGFKRNGTGSVVRLSRRFSKR